MVVEQTWRRYVVLVNSRGNRDNVHFTSMSSSEVWIGDVSEVLRASCAGTEYRTFSRAKRPDSRHFERDSTAYYTLACLGT